MADLIAVDRGAGPAAVLLHGQPGEARDWKLVSVLLHNRMRVIVPDRPGYGRTVSPALGIGANADAVVHLLDRLGIAEALVAGHSWGGGVALAVAQRHPDRVSALVLAGSIGGMGSIVRLDRVLAARWFGPGMALAAIAALSAPRVRQAVARVVGPAVLVEESRTGWYRAWRSFVVEQRALVDELPGIVARLGDVQVRAVVVVGGADRVVRPQSQRDLAARLPKGELVELPGVGHLVPREAPAELADVIASAGMGLSRSVGGD
jgi:pimeloyl-ACP methyl ester carboxylesterase